MPVVVPTRAEILEEALAAVQAERPDLSTSPDTLVGALMSAATDVSRGQHIAAQNASKDAFPDSAMDSATLEKHAEWKLGPNPKKGATTSSADAALRVTGTLAGAAVAAGDTLVYTDGTRYQLTESATVGAGTADVGIESISTGTRTRLTAGAVLRFEAAPANIEEEAVLVVSLTGGYDAETDPELLGRVQDAVANPPAGGRFSDYKAWAEEVDGVAAAYVYGPSSAAPSGRRGLGVVDVAVLTTGSGSARRPAEGKVTTVQEKIDDERPETTLGSLVLRPDAVTQDVDVQITPLAGYAWDWTGAGETVTAWTLGGLLVELSAAAPTLEAAIASQGSARLVIRGQVLVAVAYTAASGPSGGDEVELSALPATVPAPGDDIHAAGPLTASCMAAIEAVFDLLGPARGAAADPNQDWEDTLQTSALEAALKFLRLSTGEEQGVPGVRDVAVVTPVANVTPTDHAPGGTVDFLVPGEITVRPA